MAIKLKSKISIGSLFTAFSIIGSLIGISINWYQDRQLEYAVQSAQVRDLSSKAYANVLYWNDLNDHFYSKVDVLIEDVARTFKETKNYVETRDQYWRGVIILKNETNYEILQRELKTYHLKLLSYNLDSDSTFIKAITYIDRLLELNHKQYLKESQDLILAEEIASAEQTALLGNKLRSINRKFRDKDRELFKKQISKLDIYLENIIASDNRKLILRKDE